jgi:hypothetical protein
MRRLLPLLLLILLLASCGEAAPGSEGSELGTIAGTVLLGPMCPVETEASPCPDQPLPGIEVKAIGSDGGVAATAVSDEEGRFSIRVVGGDYTLEVVLDDDPSRSAGPIEVSVESGAEVQVDVPVDSGIR